MEFECHFLGWQDPFPLLVAEWITFQSSKNSFGFFDLSDCLVIVPTTLSGKMLHRALKMHLAESFLPPMIITPMGLFENHPDYQLDHKVEPTPLQKKIFWINALVEAIEKGSCGQWLKENRDFESLLSFATILSKTQEELAEKSLVLKDLTAFVEDNFFEEIGVLETIYFETMDRLGFIDPFWRKQELLKNPKLPSKIKKVVIAGCLDPHPLALQFLEKLKEPSTVDVLLPVTEKYAHYFDAKGRPLESLWQEMVLALPEQFIHLHADETEMVEEIIELVSKVNSNEATTVGICRNHLTALLTFQLKQKCIPFFNFSGLSYVDSPFFDFFFLLKELLKEPSLATITKFVRNPLFYAWLQIKQQDQADAFLGNLDAFVNAYFPSTLSDFIERNPSEDSIKKAFLLLNDFLVKLKSEHWPKALLGFFSEALENSSSLLEEQLEKFSAFLVGSLNQFNRLVPFNIFSSCEAFLSLFLEAMKEERLFLTEEGEKLELKGWLELLYDDASYLILAGFQEGDIPKALESNCILTEKVRKQLGLKTIESRLSRDMVILHTLVERLSKRGRLDIFLSKTSYEGENLLPSRLLFKVDEKALARRTALLFTTLPSKTSPKPKTKSCFLLQIPFDVPFSPESLSVSALNDYLNCPFYFYLKHKMRWQPITLSKGEMDESVFGSLIHKVLGAFGKDTEARGWNDPEQIYAFLESRLEAEFTERFGKKRTIGFQLQQKALAERLKAFSLFQADWRNQGAEIIDVEKEFELQIEGLNIRGRIDRIDYVGENNVVIIDYKTFGMGIKKDPFSSHLYISRGGKEELPPSEAYFFSGGKRWRWVNFQLPAYYHGVQSMGLGKSILAAFYFLSKVEDNSRLWFWPEDKSNFLEESMDAIRRIIRAIKENKFWPPNPKAVVWQYAPWDFWFDRNPTEIFAPSSFSGSTKTDF
ncbi:helicase I [Methylacidiphilum kamchatkense Kam1]|uniref:Helicase I n=1 Tax=Methylacidiphilum kamchatkense Kam1 TaxID=1202785 RepID=A0A0C1RJB3_9BACT|nr:PD-(D/E)XK nuclease family protein [Methylacidiphilum kamchatkense]KIE58167.1 helicase I [Methylacidiphilum kamchatkense Kam1]QDQ42143.1 PD-(D/E)XK nuclease superfamily protein [Methylacidiphilum kamchatkense Kam1]